VEVTKDNVVPHNDRNGWLAQLRETFGTASSSFALQQLNSLADAVEAKPGEKTTQNRINSALAAVSSVGAKDETEAMLAAQMAATHAAAMTLLGRVYRAQLVGQLDSYGNLAVKLLRTYAA
jgi:hypothetical protein